MKIKFIVLCAAVIGLSFASCSSCNAKLSKKSSPIDSVSYAFGVNMGESFKRSKLTNLNIKLISAAIEDVMKEKPGMTYEESMAVIQNFFMKKQQEMVSKNKEAGAKFLKENAKKAGVITTPSGLQYKIEKEGTGISPEGEDEVKVHYKGTTIDGTVFDSSYDRNEPATFKLNQVIRGWSEGLSKLKEGSKATLYIPAELAYGENGAGQIEPNSTLIFQVELLSVTKGSAAKPEAAKK